MSTIHNRDSVFKFGETLLFVEGDELIASSDGQRRVWRKDEITSLVTYRMLTRSIFPRWSLQVVTQKGTESVLVTGRENQLLIATESCAKLLEVRIEEHSGRSVEVDEHGLNVVEQMQRFPARWPRPPRTPSMSVSVQKNGDSLLLILPSFIGGLAATWFIISVLFTLGIGWYLAVFDPFGFELGAIGSISAPFWFTTLFLLILLAIWIHFTRRNGALENRHRILIDSEVVSVSSRMLKFIPLPVRTWPISEFYDLDIGGRGVLTFMLGTNRLSCNLHRRESEWVVGELATLLSPADDRDDASDTEEVASDDGAGEEADDAVDDIVESDDVVGDDAKHPKEGKLTDIPGVGPSLAKRFAEAGYTDFSALRGASEEELTVLKGVTNKTVENIKNFIG